MDSSDNERDLYRILDMLRMMSILLLLLHLYFYCYAAFKQWGMASLITDRILSNIIRTDLFNHFYTSKCWSLVLLAISQGGNKAKGAKQVNYKRPLYYFGAGLLLYFGCALLFYTDLSLTATAYVYILLTLTGYVLVLTASSQLSGMLRRRLQRDIFNTVNESFPQEERCLQNEYSINLPIRYQLQGKTRRGWINVFALRGLMITGCSGSGKSWYVIQHIIRQHIQKGFAMVIYDFKYDELTRLAYNCYLKNKSAYPVKPRFLVINFNDLSRSHRCNPLDLSTMKDVADAAESARTILLGLNSDWADRQGDFWVESSIAFLTALIWYLRKYKGGKYCTLPHTIELLQIEFGKLFSVLQTEPEIQNYINPFLSAYLNKVTQTLDNQISSLKIAMARLSSPALYYVMSGNDFQLDINNPASPKILCIGNDPQRSGIYGAAISLYITTINRLVNKKGKMKSSHIYDELPTVHVHQLSQLLATGRSNKIAVTLCIQDTSQLKMGYGRTQAEVIANLPANIICGQVSGESARLMSERIGKIMQEKESIHVDRKDTAVTQSTQLEMATPAAKIARLSAGEFVGVVADEPDEPIEHKAFHGYIIQDNEALQKGRRAFKPLPVIRKIAQTDVSDNYRRIKEEIAQLVDDELGRMAKTPGLAHLVTPSLLHLDNPLDKFISKY